MNILIENHDSEENSFAKQKAMDSYSNPENFKVESSENIISSKDELEYSDKNDEQLSDIDGDKLGKCRIEKISPFWERKILP